MQYILLEQEYEIKALRALADFYKASSASFPNDGKENKVIKCYGQLVESYIELLLSQQNDADRIIEIVNNLESWEND